MNGPNRDSPPPSDGFDPMRRRREIELMEQRFRARSGRNAGPVQTGEVDARVANEMHEFFSASQERLEKVVPGLDDGSGSGMKETTGEIRRKIDDFFAQVKDGGAGVPVNPQDVASRKPKWTGMFPDQPFDQQRSQAAGQQDSPSRSQSLRDGVPLDPPSRAAPAASGVRAPTQSGHRAPTMRPSPAEASAPQTGPIPSAPLEAPAAHSPFPPRQPSAPPSVPLVQDIDSERPKMDLRTALERLKRHGVVRSDAPAAAARPATRTPSASERPAVSGDATGPRSSAPVASAPAVPAGRANASGPQGAVRPSSHETGNHDTRTQTIQPPSQHPTFAPRRDPTRSNLPRIRKEVDIDAAPPRRDASRADPDSAVGSSVGGAAPAGAVVSDAGNLPPPQSVRAATRLPASATVPYVSPALQPGAPPVGAAPSPVRGGRPLGRGTDAATPDRALPRRPIGDMELPPRTPPGDGAPSPAAPRRMLPAAMGPAAAPAPAASAPSSPQREATDRRPVPAQGQRPVPSVDAAKAFDSIFSELEGLVRDTLKDSVDETFEAARVAEGELGAVRADVQRSASARALPPKAAPVHELDAEEISEVVELPPITSRTLAPSAVPPAAGRGQRIATPPADVGEAPEDDEEGDREPEAPAAPYDWGVRPAKRPPGAWLLGDEGGGAPSSLSSPPSAASAAPASPPAAARPRAPKAEPAAPPPAPAAAPADAAAGGPVGGRGYLVKKLSDEVLRARPALRALQDRGIISAEDLGEAPGRQSKGGDDDEVSIDHFEDRQEIDLEKELSPVRLVGELRKIRRLVDALVAKGLISPADLERAADE